MTRVSPTAVREAMEHVISEQGEIGLQIAAYVDGKLVLSEYVGLADETTGRPVEETTLFPAFSVTKSVAAVALHIQAERGLIDYSDPISRHWPEFAAHGKGRATVYDALTHRLGVPLMPAGVTPELMCDWTWMVQRIADMTPLYEPGTKSAYHSYTFGWVIGELVRRTDPMGRSFSTFVREEVCTPLGMDEVWLGTPPDLHGRIAKLTDMPPVPAGAPGVPPAVLHALAIPASVATTQAVYGRSDVRSACLPGAGGMMTARSIARLYAMLAGGGELDGVRLLSSERVRLFSVPRQPTDYDMVLGKPHNGTIGGFYLAVGASPPPHLMEPAGANPRTFGHCGAGGQIGWADPDTRSAVVILHNRLVRPVSPTGLFGPEQNPLIRVGDAVRRALSGSA